MFTLKFATANSAFSDSTPQEVVRILRETAVKIERDGLIALANVRDINGNTVGSYTFKE